MKKLFAILVAACMLAGALCITAFAADPIVLRVQALKSGEATPILIGEYTDFQDGWNEAMALAGASDEMKANGYDRIVVDLYADWNADDDGEFTDEIWNGAGFDNDTIYIPEAAKVTLNLNDHTINRGLTKDEDDGEVIFINDDADVIINNGTITGGYSNSEGGGLYIEGGANVTLNNVHIEDNHVLRDDGAGIYMYGGSTLTMNGGSLKNNTVGGSTSNYSGGAIYAYQSTVILNNVEIKNNQTVKAVNRGAAIYAKESTVSINECTFDGNGTANEAKKAFAALSIIHAVESSIEIKKSTFTNNGAMFFYIPEGKSGRGYVQNPSTLITLKESTLTIEGGCSFSNNAPVYLIESTNDSMFYISETTFSNNNASVLLSSDHLEGSCFRDCTFNNNRAPHAYFPYSFEMGDDITFFDCYLGNSKFNEDETDHIRYAYSTSTKEEAVIRVSSLLADGTIAFDAYYKDVVAGWNSAMEIAKTNAYDRVVVDLYTDWTAVDGEFCNAGAGFDYDAVYFPENVKVTLNMNGHTINRAMTTWQYNGEVISIAKGANVIINDGTIKGGWSCNGAGGIHINGAYVELNNVNVVGNVADYEDGAGIAALNSTLIMKGGSLNDNVIDSVSHTIFCCGGGLYAENSTIVLEGVEIKNNQTLDSWSNGLGIYLEECDVTIDQCIFDGNGVGDTSGDKPYPAYSTIYANDSVLTITKTSFINNGSPDGTNLGDSTVIDVDTDTNLTMDECIFRNNAAKFLFNMDGIGHATSSFHIKNTTITDNKSAVLAEDHFISGCFEKCTFSNNEYPEAFIYDFQPISKLIFRDCSMGDSDYPEFRAKNIEFQDADGNVLGVGSIFGAGSLTMVVSLLALVASCVAIGFSFFVYKKTAVPASAASGEDEE